MTERKIQIDVPILTRVEGEGALHLGIRGNRIDDLKLRIYEPPRFFEKFLEGREHQEVIDIVARICGICPVAYQMSAVQAMEDAFGHQASSWTAAMRRAMYCGEWLQSHALHIHLLALPDFLGYESALAMAVDHAELLKRGLHLQNIGNRLISLFGGRSVHPVGVRPGGFHRCPDPQRLQALLSDCRAALSEAAALVRWIADLDMPDDTQEFVSVCLRHDDEFPMAQGRIISSEGHDLPASGFDQHFREFQVPHSTALHSHLDGRPYLVGPLARMNLCMEQLTPATQSLLDNIRHPFPSRNMFHSMLARAIEIHEALVEAIRLLQWPQNNSPFEPVKPVAGVGFGATEAPRGLLWHRFAFDHEGLVTEARIVPPTSQNQARIEADLRAALARHGLDRTDDSIRMHAEKVIRNYDPCISCATHFLTLNIKRAG